MEIKKQYKNINIKIIDCSAKYGNNLEELDNYIEGKCVLFVGNSGAGKSTLTSKIIGKDLKTNELSIFLLFSHTSFAICTLH